MKKDVHCVILDDIPDHESLRCKITYKNFFTVFGVVYRAPRSPVSYIESLVHYLERMLRPNQKLVFTGDFNSPGIDWNALTLVRPDDSDSARLLLDCSFYHDLKQMVSIPTRVTEATQSTLDLAFVKNIFEDCGVSITDGRTDHKLVHASLLTDSKDREHSVQTFHDFTKANDESLLDCLHFSLGEFGNGGEVSYLWDKFKALVASCIEKFIPIRHKARKHHNTWINRDIIHWKRRIAQHRKKKTVTSELAALKQELR